ncbi:hypothetical protein [Xanthomonas hydrangeae]|uniref:hypothetical protein n=1 Tax=Xanthomonas hydrangeae TaxID=2775159 RepID=UPI001B3575F8
MGMFASIALHGLLGGWIVSQLFHLIYDPRKHANTTSHDELFTELPTNGLVRCPCRLRDRVAAWMPPPSLHGRTCGVSRKRRGHRALD